jgi:putative transcriptional regulator
MTMTRKLPPWLAALLSAAGLLVAIAAFAQDNPPPAADPPAGQLLIAAATMQDPRFYHSVILLLRHDRKGAFGIAINRPLGKKPIADLLAEAAGKNADPGKDRADGTLAGDIEVYLGGPVQPQYGFVIHSGDYRRPETLRVGNGLAMTASTAVLRDIGHRKGPKKYLFALGYAGWASGQLEGEIARHDWFTTPAEPSLVFDADRAGLWKTALARRSQEL